MSRIILMAESGSDITPEQAKQNGIVIVPMHVSFGGETRDDGAFPTTEMFDFYKKHRELPRTSGCTPHDFEAVFERLDRELPGCVDSLSGVFRQHDLLHAERADCGRRPRTIRRHRYQERCGGAAAVVLTTGALSARTSGSDA